ncbi:TetR/AcrR family transcriptional regulator [Pontibacter diazotrophicus]|uniref:TetR/AcrR family transcriptional regulator n=1 Tax=Pontibacter diazotrophicus TaxID=1400979 RepID=A0A3D8LBH3_9BACT|nr:TetR/AcrR family transcriptional regulator [Pontibacter diazotrophicus]RDV14789.1 TetR/AcrR family transcriptional regulator [Pontibacter diazotrophicus]
MKKTEEKREKSKKILVETALSLFSENGYEATSIRQIASEAGVSLGLMYNYFSSKEELLLEIFRLGYKDIQHSFAKSGKPEGTSALKQHILQTVQLLKEKKHFWRLLHSLRFQRNIMAPVALEVQEQINYVEAQLKDNLMEAGVHAPDLEAKLLFASIDGMAMHYLLNENYPLDEVANQLIQKYTTH